MKPITLTPALTEALSEFLDEEQISIDLRTIEELQDFFLDVADHTDRETILSYIIFVRQIRASYLRIVAAMKT